MKRRYPILVALTLLTATVALAADELPKLPKAIALPKSEKSPGVVTFRHKSHVSVEAADCTVCHPKMWPIRPGSTKPTITHKDMKKGEFCGKCHDAKAAFGLEDCENCHATE